MTAKKPKNRLQKLSLVMQNNVKLFKIVQFLSKNVALIHECSLNNLNAVKLPHKDCKILSQLMYLV